MASSARCTSRDTLPETCDICSSKPVEHEGLMEISCYKPDCCALICKGCLVFEEDISRAKICQECLSDTTRDWKTNKTQGLVMETLARWKKPCGVYSSSENHGENCLSCLQIEVKSLRIHKRDTEKLKPVYNTLVKDYNELSIKHSNLLVSRGVFMGVQKLKDAWSKVRKYKSLFTAAYFWQGRYMESWNKEKADVKLLLQKLGEPDWISPTPKLDLTEEAVNVDKLLEKINKSTTQKGEEVLSCFIKQVCAKRVLEPGVDGGSGLGGNSFTSNKKARWTTF
jgi:hypothetical protein